MVKINDIIYKIFFKNYLFKSKIKNNNHFLFEIHEN